MLPTVTMLSLIGGKAASDNMNSIISGLKQGGVAAGLDLPHRLAHYIAQLAHESAAFKYDQEIASGRSYEGRTDLGNTEPGDGPRFKGRTAGQITGRYNYRKFTKWVREVLKLDSPDFEQQPELLNTDPWEGLGPIWFWATHGLNKYADKNDIEMVTRTWNGGLNGFDSRLHYYTRTALVLLGRPAEAIKGFQLWAQQNGTLPAGADQIDGIAGLKTRTALHMALVALAEAKIAEDDTADVAAAPVVVTEVEVPKGSDKPGLSRWFGGISLVGLGSFFTDMPTGLKYGVAVAVVLLVIALIWRGEQIALRAKRIVKAFE